MKSITKTEKKRLGVMLIVGLAVWFIMAGARDWFISVFGDGPKLMLVGAITLLIVAWYFDLIKDYF